MQLDDTFDPNARGVPSDEAFSYAVRVGALLAVHTPQLIVASPLMPERLDGDAVNANINPQLTNLELCRAAAFFNKIDDVHTGHVEQHVLAEWFSEKHTLEYMQNSLLFDRLWAALAPAVRPGAFNAAEFVVFMHRLCALGQSHEAFADGLFEVLATETIGRGGKTENVGLPPPLPPQALHVYCLTRAPNLPKWWPCRLTCTSALGWRAGHQQGCGKEVARETGHEARIRCRYRARRGCKRERSD